MWEFWGLPAALAVESGRSFHTGQAIGVYRGVEVLQCVCKRKESELEKEKEKKTGKQNHIHIHQRVKNARIVQQNKSTSNLRQNEATTILKGQGKGHSI